MGMLADQITESIIEDVRESFETMGGEIVADIRESISIPVELAQPIPRGVSQKMRELYGSHFDRHYIRPRARFSGQSEHVIRSRPGEPPRRETGRLWEGVRMEVGRPSQWELQLDIVEDEFYGAILEYDRDRPFFGPAWERWRDVAPGMIQIRTF